jgi:aerotaxis receptor
VRKLAETATKQTVEITASVNEIQRITQIAVTGMEAAGTHVASADAAMIQAHAGLDTVSDHGNEVVSISRQIAQGTRQQSAAGNEIAAQLDGIMGGIEQTSASINGVSQKAALMKDSSAKLRQLISYFQFKR